MSSPGDASSTAAKRLRSARPDHRQQAIAADGLPEPVSSFVGRRDDVAEVAGLVARSRLVTICGPGGMGKTRVVIEVARVCQGQDATVDDLDGEWIVELASISDPGLVAQTVLSEL